MQEWGFNDKNTTNGILIVDSYEQLNSLRVGSSRVSRPAAHNYSSSFFVDNALIFLTVTTPNLETQFLFFYALVTDSQYFYPVFGLTGRGMLTAIGSRSFVIEVPRAIVDNYDAGSLKMGPGWGANWGIEFEGEINWLCEKCKSSWPIMSTETLGIRAGEDDSLLEQKNYCFSISNDHLYWQSPLGGEHDVYIQRRNSDHFEYLFNSYGSGGINLIDLGLADGINKIKVVGSRMIYLGGEFIRYYDCYDIEKAIGYSEESYQLSLSLTSIASKATLVWNSENSFYVYVKRANSIDFERIIDRWNRPVSTTGSRGVEIDSFGFESGENIIKTIRYKFLDGKAVETIAEMPLTLGSESRVNYNFIVGGGGTGIGGGGHFIGWAGTNQLYNVYLKYPDSSEFESIHGHWDNDINGGIVRFCNIADWQEKELPDGAHILRVEGWQFSGGIISKIVSEFEFEVKTKENSNIKFSLDSEKLRWDYEKPWHIHLLSIKHANSNDFQLVSSLAIGGLDTWDGVELKALGLTSGANLVRVTVAWSLSGNILTRHVGYFTIHSIS